MTQFQVVAPIKHPPALPLPEDLRKTQSLGGGHQEIVSTSPALAEIQQAQSIFCRFWIVANEIFLIYRDNESGVKSLAFALRKYHKLLALVDTLPKSMVRQDRSSHWVLILQ